MAQKKSDTKILHHKKKKKSKFTEVQLFSKLAGK